MKPYQLNRDDRGRPVTVRAERPYTVTRGLPFIISPHLTRLRRLKREWDWSDRWHGSRSKGMIEAACEKLHQKVYGQTCYYGCLPPGCDAEALYSEVEQDSILAQQELTDYESGQSPFSDDIDYYE